MRGIAGDDQGGMGQGRPRRLAARGLEHQNRLEPCGCASGREKARRIADVVDRQQNGPRRRVRPEMIEAVGDVDIGAVAENDRAGEADAAPGRPGENACRDRI